MPRALPLASDYCAFASHGPFCPPRKPWTSAANPKGRLGHHELTARRSTAARSANDSQDLGAMNVNRQARSCAFQQFYGAQQIGSDAYSAASLYGADYSKHDADDEHGKPKEVVTSAY